MGKANAIGAQPMSTQTIYADSRGMTIHTEDPRDGDGDTRQLVTIQVYEGMGILEALSTLQGWLQGMKLLEPEERRTVARIDIG